MANDLVPELHDIFKLTKFGHIYSEDFPYRDLVPDNETWEGIIKHHCSRNFQFFPDTPTTFFLCIADSLAASVSRQSLSISRKRIDEDEDNGDRFGVRKLWNPKGEQKGQQLKSEEDIISLMKFIASNPSKEDFFKRYKDLLRWRSEDANPAKCITSVFTHSDLTGKIFRILSSEKSFQITKNDLAGKQKDQISKLINDKSNEWKLTLSKIRINFNKNPMRARDLNVFVVLDELVEEIRQEYYDNFLLRSGNEILLISSEKEIVKQIKPLFEKYNFWLQVVSATGNIQGEIKANPKDMQGAKASHEYFEMKPFLKPPICEICQTREATKVWEKSTQRDYGINEMNPDIFKKDEVYEYLCESCVLVRNLGSRLPKLEQWHETQGKEICWIMLKLDIDQLTTTLDELYIEYLQSLGSVISTKELSVGFSVISEFYWDYQDFTKDFNQTIKNEYGSDSFIRILDEFLCVQICSNSDVMKILEMYNALMTKHFPEFYGTKRSPIKLLTVISSINFPFFEVWRIFEQTNPDVYISLVGHGEIKTNLNGAKNMLSAKTMNFRKSSLHNLAEIAKINKSLAKLHFNDKSDRADSVTYSQLGNLVGPLGMDFGSILTFAKILEG
ncbi:MAG: hypothetical protein WCE90_06590 [Candidatus Zixiibacteriota bacterium]